MSSRWYLALFVAGVVITGWLIGWLNVPGDWYAALEKPWFNPPNWIFGPVWTVLYVLIGIVGWRVWFRASDRMLRGLWAAQMVLNFAWSPAFFGLENVSLALVIIILLLLVLLRFLVRARTIERVSGRLFVPYVAWVSFATLLNASIWWLN